MVKSFNSTAIYFLKIQNVKKIEAPKEITKKEKNNVIEYKSLEKVSKSQEISDILRILGVDRETILKVLQKQGKYAIIHNADLRVAQKSARA